VIWVVLPFGVIKNNNNNQRPHHDATEYRGIFSRYAQWRKIVGNAELIIRQSFSSPCVNLYSFAVVAILVGQADFLHAVFPTDFM